MIGAFSAGGALIGVAGCNTQSLVPVDGGAARGGTSGTAATSGGVDNRNGGSGGDLGTTAGGSGGDLGTTGAGGDGTSGFGGDVGAGGVMGTTGAAGFNRSGGGGIAGHGASVPGDGGGPSAVDASTITPPDDAGACQCVLGTDGVLRMSWDCFSANYGSGAPMSGWCGGPGGWVSSCGLDVFKLNRDDPTIPDDEWVYDATGATVGQQIAEVSPVFVCPSDPSLRAPVVAGGRFPPAGCAVQNCSCGDAGAVNCPIPDAGTAGINPF